MAEKLLTHGFFRKLSTLLPLLLLIFSGYSQAKLIAVAVSNEDNFRNLITNSIEKTADIYGDDTYIDSAGGDFQTQYEQIKRFVQTGVDAIIVIAAGTPEQNKTLLPFAKQVPLVFVNAEPLDNLNDLPANSVYVGSNEEQSGTLEMEELARLAGQQGKVAMLRGVDTHKAAIMRTQDVKNVMAKYPQMKLVKNESANWQRNQAYQVVTGWMKENVDFNILVANNDEMAIGGIMAIKDSGKNPADYLIGGVDATQDALKEMQSGRLDVTVLQDAAGQGRAAVEASYQLMNGVSLDKAVWIPFRLVTPDNYLQYLKK
ncbi:substrate-binding domain-containing protein [Vibrio quintilis]|uniref:Autoinducer 2-binding periplasmic protein LuxP n=1 Tax=Vibrio quintilis TaxID=1117707 RepID=A0A1M7Z044_9VIBR|nr:substrate-binding domain-containing protein [Vibrio quintilis]SHO58261.1 D-galactose-binding periplasmic protein precursor [Vibrio quintilis]